MKTFGITQQAAEWLLGKPGLLDALHAVLPEASTLSELKHGDFIEGPIRLSASTDGELLLFWHADYLSGTGDEDWGFIVLGGEYGLFQRPDISREVFERNLYVINQRLQGYLIEGAYIHRSYPNGAHTCLAGRGTDARQVSIAYVERDVLHGSTTVHTVLSTGPQYDLTRLSNEAAKTAAGLTGLVGAASTMIDPTRKRQALRMDHLTDLRDAIIPYITSSAEQEYHDVAVPAAAGRIAERDSMRTYGWTYAEWLAPTSPLSLVQRRLLVSDAVERHPVRIVGPGGSGKTLLMQLLALKRLELAGERDVPARVLYLAHNAKMAETVRHRFEVLRGALSNLTSPQRTLQVQTLAEYGRGHLGLDEALVIDPDAHEAKEFQLRVLEGSLKEAMRDHLDIVEQSPLLREIRDNPTLFAVMTRLVMAEVSNAIKSHGLAQDEKRYIQSERRLSRLHGVLDQDERRVVFTAFQKYHAEVFEGYGVLDSDDVALSLLGQLRAPIWQLKRKELGFDYVFVDEAQLFNENERRVLPLLTKGTTSHVPIVLALDEAQEIYGQASAGLSTLGIADIANESLSSIHRSTRSIIRLAFHVIQRSTDLFGPDFPDFTSIADNMEDDDHPMAAMPRLERLQGPQAMPRAVLKRIRGLRKANLWRLAVVCFADQYWRPLLDELRKSDLPLRVLEHRGERLPGAEPVVVLSRPSHIGGQEFDAVLLVGLEQGLVPPRVIDNDALAAAVEQQAIREIYLGITRARYQIIVVISPGATPTPFLFDAETAGLIEAIQNG